MPNASTWLQALGRRPLAVTVISLLFIGAGSVGLAYHLTEVKLNHPFNPELIWILVLRAVAVVGGVFLFLGRSWARWLLVLWLALHVWIAALHSLGPFITHAVLLVVIAYFLFRRSSSRFFNPQQPPSAGGQGSVDQGPA